MGNPKPTFALTNMVITHVSWFGKSGEHLRIRVASSELSFEKDSIEGISFYAKRQLGKATEKLEEGGKTTVLATLERDTFTRGQPVRLRLVSIR